MSISIITDADIPSITRTGTLFDNIGGLNTPVDAGTGINIAITGNASEDQTNLTVPPNGPNQFVYGVSTSSYSVGGTVDFSAITTDIPLNAHITKIEIECFLEYSILVSLILSYSVFPTGSVDGSVSAGIKASLVVANTAFTPTSETSVNDLSSDENGAPAASISLSTSATEAGIILEKIWDIANDSGQFPLGYITRAQLVAQFDSQRITFVRPTPSTLQPRIGASGFEQLLGTGVGNYRIAPSATITITTSNWLMTVHWEVPFSWTLNAPSNPIQAGDTVTATSDPLNPVPPLDFTQVTSVTLSSPSGDITVITFSATDENNFSFLIPTLTGSPGTVSVIITSTQFSGTVNLGNLATIFFLNATGIYTLTPGKTDDTIYDNDNGGTIDVKIPDPFFKTGFIGG